MSYFKFFKAHILNYQVCFFVVSITSLNNQVQSAAREPATPTSAVFFEETDTYWAPSSIVNELYEQLATRKYREIPRDQIQ